MMKNYKRYTITSALPYANGPLHVGHIAGAYLPADIFVRYLKLKEKDVVFICGSDENGAAITIQAKKEGRSPQEIVDTYHTINKKAFVDLGIDFDIFHRTSSELHHETASDYFLKLYEKGVFEEKTSKQYYDEEYEQFLADRYIKGECPNCANPDAYGDQCEKCGRSLSPLDLINPLSTLSEKPPVLRETKHWYLPLQQHEKWLREWLETGKIDGVEQHDPAEWKKNVLGQCLSWLNDGLHERSVTRDLSWGVNVPLEGAEGKVLYVWLDAPIGYISATKQWAADNAKDWKLYWQDEESKLLHFIGKDNIVFHCIIFPAILKTHGDYILPANVPANEFMNLEGNKISTSRNYAVWVHEFIDDFPDKIDVLRYMLCANMPETKDSEFTWDDFLAKNNNELVAILGNLVNRVAVLTHKYFDGVLNGESNRVDWGKIDLEFGKDGFASKVENSLEQYRFREALNEVMNVARAANKYLTDEEPWKRIKVNEEETADILMACAQIIANITILIRPFMPFTSEKMIEIMNLDSDILKWSNVGSNSIVKNGHRINKAELLFEKMDETMIEEQKAKLVTDNLEVDAATNTVPEISFDEFQKMDIRIGTIKEAEKVEKADKLLKLKVDLGTEVRTIVSGIAMHFNIDDLPGQQVSVLTNLAPRKIRGVLSQGMILMAEHGDTLDFIVPKNGISDGSKVS
ncbi:MAG: methionine--tRNA ligase [Chitinophagales bacterium]|nr:methionine--tRNA ligase [Chitinophagales bacterium]